MTREDGPEPIRYTTASPFNAETFEGAILRMRQDFARGVEILRGVDYLMRAYPRGFGREPTVRDRLRRAGVSVEFDMIQRSRQR